MSLAVCVQSNDADENTVIAFDRSADGSLSQLGTYATGGKGTGQPHLPSADSLVFSDDGQWLLAVNPGSDELSLFAVEPDGLMLADCVSSRGSRPTSVASHGNLAYVMNNGTPCISGFNIAAGKLTELIDSRRDLSGGNADPAQISFTADGGTLVATERGTNSISSYVIGDTGYADGPATIASSGQTPYGFDFTADSSLIVSEAFGGQQGKAAASSYAMRGPGEFAPVSQSVGDNRTEVCWVAITADSQFAYVTNFGDGTVSCYEIQDDGTLELRDPVAGSSEEGHKGLRDEAISGDSRYLYAIDADAQKLIGWSLGSGGRLSPAAEAASLPPTVAGLAAI